MRRAHPFPSRRQPQAWRNWFWLLPSAALIALATLAVTSYLAVTPLDVDICLDAGGAMASDKVCEVDCTTDRWKDGPLEGWRCAPAS